MKMNKKGFMQDLGALGIGVVSLVIILAVAFLILAQVKANASVAADGNATAAVNTLTAAAATIPNWVPILIIVFIGAIVIGAVGLFGRKR